MIIQKRSLLYNNRKKEYIQQYVEYKKTVPGGGRFCMYLFYGNLIGHTLELHCDVLTGEALEGVSVGIVVEFFDGKA